MTEAIIVALITGGLSLVGVVVSTRASGRKTEASIRMSQAVTNTKLEESIRASQAVTDTKLEELTREVREHNGFAKRMPVVEEQIKVINHRIADLEDFHRPE